MLLLSARSGRLTVHHHAGDTTSARPREPFKEDKKNANENTINREERLEGIGMGRKLRNA
jgi:hypothetical protein